MQGALTEDLLDAVYDGALRSGDWQPALGALRRSLDAADVAFTVFNPHTQSAELWETTGRVLTRAACETYRNDYLRLDPKLSILAESGPGFLFNDADHFDDAFVASHPFY